MRDYGNGFSYFARKIIVRNRERTRLAGYQLSGNIYCIIFGFPLSLRTHAVCAEREFHFIIVHVRAHTVYSYGHGSASLARLTCKHHAIPYLHRSRLFVSAGIFNYSSAVRLHTSFYNPFISRSDVARFPVASHPDLFSNLKPV